jgi:hypothetical protein
MRATLDEARAIKNRFRHATVDVFPYRPIPGAALWQDAIDKGYQAPTTAREWGQMFEYKVDSWKGAIPAGVTHDWSVFSFLAPWVDGHVKCNPVMKKLLVGSARWRMKTGFYKLPLEFKAYHRARQLVERLWTSQAAAR